MMKMMNECPLLWHEVLRLQAHITVYKKSCSSHCSAVLR